MLEPLIIRRSRFLPLIHFSKQENIFLIEGKSIPEDSNEFYSVVFEWLALYEKEPNPQTVVTLKLDYYNSSSARQIANMIKVFDQIYKNGNDVRINWIYSSYDEVMKENGEDFSKIFSVPIHISTNN